jgi:hypothetical protein
VKQQGEICALHSLEGKQSPVKTIWLRPAGMWIINALSRCHHSLLMGAYMAYRNKNSFKVLKKKLRAESNVKPMSQETSTEKAKLS